MLQMYPVQAGAAAAAGAEAAAVAAASFDSDWYIFYDNVTAVNGFTT